MMSNHSSFSIGRYLSYQLKRSNYLLVIFSLIALLMGPLITYLAIMNQFEYVAKVTEPFIHNAIHSYIGGMGAFSVYFGAGFLGIVFALFLSSFLQSKRATNFYHALPVKRSSWLLSQYLLGFTLFTLINIITFIGLIGVVFYIGGFSNIPWLALGIHFLQSELFFLCSFALSMLAGQLTGNTLGHLGMIGIIQFGVTALGLVLYGFMNSFYETFIESRFVENIISLSLPAAYIRFMEKILSDRGINVDETKEIIDFALPYMGHMMIGLMAVFSILAIVLSFMAYRARRLERASETLIFKSLNLPLKCYLGLIAGSAFGLLLNGISGNGFFLFVGIISGVILLHIFYEMAVNRDVRAVLKPINWLSTGAIAVLTIVFAMSFVTDAFGYDTYKPKEESVINVSINAGNPITSEIEQNPNSEEHVLVSPENIKAILAIAQLGIDNLGGRKDEGFVEAVPYETTEALLKSEASMQPQEEWTWIKISYRLKEGTTVARHYQVPTKAFYEIFSNVFESQEYRSLVKEIYSEHFSQIKEVVFYDEYLENDVLKLQTSDAARFDAFKKAILSDLEKRTVKHFSGRKIADCEFSGSHTFGRIDIYEGDKATVAFLRKMEAQKITKAGRSFYLDKLPDFRKIVISGYDEQTKEYRELKIVTNKKEIEDYIKNKTIDGSSMRYFREDIDERFDVVPYLSDGQQGKIRYFKKGMTPKGLI